MSIATLHLPIAPSRGDHARGTGRALRSVGCDVPRPQPSTARAASSHGAERSAGIRPRSRRQAARSLALLPTVEPLVAAPQTRSRVGAPPAEARSPRAIPSASARPGAVPGVERPTAVRPASSRRPAQAPLRLTRRGRLSLALGSTVLGVVACTFAVGAWLPGDGASPSDARVEPVAVHSTTVLPGQTLWEIAARLAPDDDRRDTIQRILQANDLDSAHVVAGQQLVLPGRR